MKIKIVLCKDGVYDIYDEMSGKWIFSASAPDNVFARLSQMPCVQINFVDKTIPKEIHDAYCASTSVACCYCQPGPCEHRKS